MPRSNFGVGSPITSQFLNKVARPQISSLDEDGHLPLLDNAAFRNESGVVGYDFYNLVDRFQSHVAPSGGLNLYVHGGTLQAPNGLPVVIAATTLVLPDNRVSFVYVDPDGIKVSATNPPAGIRSARVTTGSGQIVSVQDLRYDYLWIPNVQGLSVFGGTSTTDLICTNGQVLRGTIECRDFTVGSGITVTIDRECVIRASRDVLIQGVVNTATNPVSFGATTSGALGTTTGSVSSNVLGSEYPNPIGSGVSPFVPRNAAWRGAFVVSVSGVTTASNAAIFCSYSSFVGTGFNITGGTSGALFTVNAAGSISLTATAQINCAATNTFSLSPASGLAIITGHPTAGNVPTTWNITTDICGQQAVAGRIILQSLTRIDVATGAVLNVKGADRGEAKKVVWTQAGGSTTTNWIMPGAGGGGGIHYQAPVLNVSPSASMIVLPGNQPVTPANERFDGIGCSGNGYIAATNTNPTAGSITSSTEVPRER